MKFLGFYPETAVARIRAASPSPRVPTLLESLGTGAGGFCAVSVVVFAGGALTEEWLRRRVGEAGSYAVYALAFIFLAGGLFRRLVIKPAPWIRFYIVFALAFLLYSAGWATDWVFLRNKPGEWLGSLIGTMALGLTLGAAFDAPKQTLKIIGALFLTRSAGYFLGELLQHAIPGFAGRLLWGATYGLGLGTGIGYSLYACQEPLRARLRTGAAEPAAAARAHPDSGHE